MTLGIDEWFRLQYLLGKQQSGQRLSWEEENQMRDLIARQGYPQEAKTLGNRELAWLGLGLVAAWFLMRKK
jgi:hypothetical protein